MSDDLVKRARHNALADMPHYASVELIETMADRIEELEAEIKSMAMDCLVAHGQASDAYQAQLAAEAKIEEARCTYSELVNQWSDPFEDDDGSDETWSQYVSNALKQLGDVLKGESG